MQGIIIRKKVSKEEENKILSTLLEMATIEAENE